MHYSEKEWAARFRQGREWKEKRIRGKREPISIEPNYFFPRDNLIRGRETFERVAFPREFTSHCREFARREFAIIQLFRIVQFPEFLDLQISKSLYVSKFSNSQKIPKNFSAAKFPDS